jgi:hypothetical protein
MRIADIAPEFYPAKLLHLRLEEHSSCSGPSCYTRGFTPMAGFRTWGQIRNLSPCLFDPSPFLVIKFSLTGSDNADGDTSSDTE